MYLYMKAETEDRSTYKDYELTMTQDLFSKFCVISKWGRIGRKGRVLTKQFDTEDEALKHFKTLVNRRKSLPKRANGSQYHVVSASAF